MTRGAAGLRILAVSGSLRAASSNTTVLAALRLLAPPGVVVTPYDGLRHIPPFDPDEDAAPPQTVTDLKAMVAAADALVIASPEYARGIAGSLKNALDWLVSGAEMPGKPIALINTAPRASCAQAALRLTLETMSARIIEGACATVPLLGRRVAADAIAADPSLAAPLLATLDAIVSFVSRSAAAARPL